MIDAPTLAAAIVAGVEAGIPAGHRTDTGELEVLANAIANAVVAQLHLVVPVVGGVAGTLT